jgi:hypothetical protein
LLQYQGRYIELKTYAAGPPGMAGSTIDRYQAASTPFGSEKEDWNILLTLSRH